MSGKVADPYREVGMDQPALSPPSVADPIAVQRAAEAETAVAAALLAGFKRRHPKVPATITREGTRWIIREPEGAAWRATRLAGDRAHYVRVDPHAVDVDLDDVGETERMPLPPEPPPVPTTGLDVGAEVHRALTLLDRLRVGAETARIALRGVEAEAEAEIARLRNVAPLDAINVEGRLLSPEPGLLRLVQETAEARATVATLGATLAEARALMTDLRPRLAAALVDVALAKDPERVRDVPGLGAVGEMHLARVSDHSRKLDAAEEACDRLARAVEEVGPLLGLFVAASERYALAALTVAREVGVRTRAAWLDSVRPLAVKLRTATTAEILAEQTCTGLDTRAVPRLTWSDDLLAAPTLTVEKMSGGK